jgi:hypothetical protein
MVVYKNAIYVCDPQGQDTVQGVIPGTKDEHENEHFYIYLQDRTASVDECLTFMESGEGENKPVDISTIQAILNHFMIGIDGKGIIGDMLELTPQGKPRLVIGGVNYTVSKTEYNTILSDMMQDTGVFKDHELSINNGVFKVSNKLPELQIYGIGECCILRQYTTYNGEKDIRNRVRVQELIDPKSGLIFLRGIVGKNQTPGPFKCSVINSYRVKEQIDRLVDVYAGRIEYLQAVEDALKDSFRYRHLFRNMVNATSLIISFSNKEDIYYTGPTDFITILLRKKVSTGNEDLVYESESISISLKESLSCSYKIFGGSNSLILTPNKSNNSLTIKTDKDNVVITEIIYREYYGT